MTRPTLTNPTTASKTPTKKTTDAAQMGNSDLANPYAPAPKKGAAIKKLMAICRSMVP